MQPLDEKVKKGWIKSRNLIVQSMKKEGDLIELDKPNLTFQLKDIVLPATTENEEIREALRSKLNSMRAYLSFMGI
ncbi:MAG: hypothetical protein U1E88_05370 [Acinetobacter sp.]